MKHRFKFISNEKTLEALKLRKKSTKIIRKEVRKMAVQVKKYRRKLTHKVD
jgi:hypothetical protein